MNDNKEYSSLPEEYGSTALEHPRPGAEFPQPPPEYSAESLPGERRKKSRAYAALRRLMFAGAAILSCGVLLAGTMGWGSGGRPAPKPSPAPIAILQPAGGETQMTLPAPAESPAPIPEPTPEPTPAPAEIPASTEEPVATEPVILPIFYNFSHDHRGRIQMENTDRLHSVLVTVRETVLDLPVFEHYLDESEIAAGLYELPALSTGDVYMENMDAFDEKNAWPEFEMKVVYWYENETGDGEESEELVLEPRYEMGFGATYWGPDDTWDEQLPPDSIVIRPYDDVDNIRYTFDSLDSVKDPTVVYVSVEYDGRKLDPETFQTILIKDEYTMMDQESGTEIPVVAYQSTLVIPRPDWVPKGGTIHITIGQMLSVTGELFMKEFDLELS